MKIIILLLISFVSSQVWAGRATVIVLEAPLLTAPSMDARVLRNLRWGDDVYLEKTQLERDQDQENGFWETMDRNTTKAYIPKQYVKVVYNDDREFASSVNRFSHDPTDYRIEEPLSEYYPLYLADKRRTWFSFGIGTPTHANYNYQSDFENQEFISRKTFLIGYQKNVSFDKTDRFYFGGFTSFSTEEARFIFNNDLRARESRGQIGIGPFISYDIFRSDDYLFTIGGGFLVNWNRHLVSYATREGEREERLFNGISLASRAHAVFHFRDIIMPKINFTLGLETEVSAPQKLSPQSNSILTGVWNEHDDSISIPLRAHHAFYLGISSSY